MNQALPLASPSKSVGTDASYGPRAHLLVGLVYPLWYFVTPDGAIDAWWTWAGVGLVFVVSAGLASIQPKLNALLHGMFPGPWASAFQIFTLASINDMQFFYAGGSVMAVLAFCAVIRSKKALLSYVAFITFLACASFAVDPDALKIACWGGVLPAAAIIYLRLASVEMQEHLESDYRARLELQVQQRTRELTDANQRLQHEIQERQILEQRTRTASKMEAVGRLAGRMAHEFNNLLTRIRLYSELALEAAEGAPPVRQEIDEIERAASSAADLTKQLLSLSLRGQSRPTPVDLNEVVRSNQGMLETLLRGSKLQCWLSEAPLVVMGEVREIEQILVNLALNASDAMEGLGEVVIETLAANQHAWRRADVPANGWALLRFSDSGHGMDEATRERAFDPFFTQKQHGTGLGLSVIHGILQQAGGHASVDSKPGEGTTFELCWPRASVLSEEPALPAPSESSMGRGERILLVEDQEAVREALARLIRSHDYRVETCSTAEQALQLAKRETDPFKLLISDVVLDGMSGIELASRARAEGLPLEILLISGHLEQQDGGRLGEIPPECSFLPKPFSSTELLDRVRQLMSDPGVAPLNLAEDSPPPRFA